MILVLAGTSEGRIIAEVLSNAGYKVIACTATAYGSSLLNKKNVMKIFTGKLETEGIINLIRSQGIHVVVDATHPFAEKIKINARKASKETGSFYIRYERPGYTVPEHPLVNRVHGYKNAADMAVALEGQTLFLTTGTNTLPIFTEAAQKHGKSIVTRILPGMDSIKTCFDLGIPATNIIAMQGPFSVALNKALFTEYGANILITKDSGIAGGTPAKTEAAIALGIPVIVISRPEITTTKSIDTVYSVNQLLTLISSLRKDT